YKRQRGHSCANASVPIALSSSMRENHRWQCVVVALAKRSTPSVIGNRDDHTSKHLNQESKTEDCPLKFMALQTSHSRAPRERRQENSSSNSSDVGIPEVKANNMDVPVSSNTAASEQSNSDNSDLSDQERGRAQVSKWSAPVELYLRPEPYNNDLDSSYSPVTVDEQVYPQVLPAPLKDLDFTHGDPSTELSDSQQRLFSADPCLAPLVVRLLELEKLQSATVQKERAKRPTTARAQTKNSTRSKNCELMVSKSWSPEDADCNSVTCSFTKLSLCPNTSSCRCRRDACPMAKLRYRSREMCLQQYQTLLKHPQAMPGKLNRPVAVVPVFSVSVKTSPKPKTPNRTRRLRTTKKSSSRPQRDNSTSAKKTRTASIRKSEF
uniref:Uncharacterized protein n=1 Tax=Astyanax mexicanus TaxID=7994 RepID=A0A3B1K3R2_ASTMX